MLLRRIAIVMIAATIANVARAADLDDNYGYADQLPAPPAVAQSKVEFGTGWYVRGDLGVTTLPSLQLSNPASLPTASDFSTPSAPGLAIGNGSNAGYVASLGGGYSFNRWFRADLIADFHEPITKSAISGNQNVFCPTGVSYPDKITSPTTGKITWGSPAYSSGGCTGNYNGHIQSFDILVNGYIDLFHWYSVTPYVGAGVGLSFGHYQTSAKYIQGNGVPYQATIVDPQFGSFYYNYDSSSSGTYYNFAFAGMAGIAIDVFDHTKLDVGYRYLNLGTVPQGHGTLYEHEVRAGLRYMIDN